MSSKASITGSTSSPCPYGGHTTSSPSTASAPPPASRYSTAAPSSALLQAPASMVKRSPGYEQNWGAQASPASREQLAPAKGVGAHAHMRCRAMGQRPREIVAGWEQATPGP